LVVSGGMMNGPTLDHENGFVHSGLLMVAHVVPVPVPAGP